MGKRLISPNVHKFSQTCPPYFVPRRLIEGVTGIFTGSVYNNFFLSAYYGR